MENKSDEHEVIKRPVRLKDAKAGELGQVSTFELLNALDRMVMMILAAVFIGVGTG